jgi:hypothetical protein
MPFQSPPAAARVAAFGLLAFAAAACNRAGPVADDAVRGGKQAIEAAGEAIGRAEKPPPQSHPPESRWPTPSEGTKSAGVEVAKKGAEEGAKEADRQGWSDTLPGGERR